MRGGGSPRGDGLRRRGRGREQRRGRRRRAQLLLGRPPEPAGAGQHQRGAGRQGPRHDLPGAEEVRPRDRRGQGHARREDRDLRLAELHRHRQGRLDLLQRREGHRPVLRGRLELRREPQEQPAQRVLLRVHRRLRQGASRKRLAERRHALRAQGDRSAHLHRQAQPEVLQLPRHPRLQRLRATAQGVLRRPRRLAQETGRQRALPGRQLQPRLPDVPAHLGRLPRSGQGAERRRGPQGLHRQQHRLHRPDRGQPRPRRRRPGLAAQERQERPRRPVHQHPRGHHPDPRLPVLRQRLEQVRLGEGPQGPVHGDRPQADHRHDLPEHPYPRHRLDLTGPRRGGRLQAGACAGTPASTTPRRPGSWSRRAAGSPAARSRSRTTPTPAPTSSGSTRSATPSTTPWTTTAPAPATRSAPSPTSATRSPARR
ncbi:hypothetical protein RKD37_003576 [Streptomyces ambofaciens]